MPSPRRSSWRYSFTPRRPRRRFRRNNASPAAEECSSRPAAKASYFVGEPLDLTFTLRNVAANPVKGSFCMSLEHYNPEVWYRKQGQNFLLFVGNFPAASDTFCAPEDVAPNGNKTLDERLLYASNPAGLLLREAGTYEFKARFKLNDGQGTALESNVVSVEVKPAPDSEGEALARWSDPEMLDFLQGNEGYVSERKTKAGMDKAVNFFRSHGGSIYAAAARKGLLKYLTPRAEGKRLTPEEQVIYERLSAEP
jgi:hypothetical protein